MIEENSYIGALLLSPIEVLAATRGLLKATDFENKQARAIYQAACELTDTDQVVDPVTIKARGNVDDKYMIECMEITATTANAIEYAQAVHDLALGREVRRVCTESAMDKVTKSEELLNSTIAELQLLQAGTRLDVEAPLETAKNFYLRLTDTNYTAFTSTGYGSLDTALGGGLVTSGMIAIAARPGVGKTMLGLCIADNVAATGVPVLYISLEMDKYQLMCRRVGRLSGLSYNALQRGRVDEDDAITRGKATEALSQLMTRPLYIEDAPASITDVELKARGIQGLGMIVIDHMGLLKSATKGSRYEIVTELSHSIKRLALSLSVPIVTLCQLNRENEGQWSHRRGL